MGTTTDTRRQDASRGRAAALAQHTEEVRQRQAAALGQLDCLTGVRVEHLRRIAGLATLRTFTPGEVLLDERSPGDYLYIVLRGTVCLRLHDRVGREVLIGFLNRGDCFGEGPIFGDRFRSASARAETICYILQFPLAEVRALLADSPELEAMLRMVYRERLVASTLGRVPLFSQLSPLARAGIAEMLVQRHYPRGMAVIRHGAPGEALYLVESGQVVVEAEGLAIAHLEEGDFFGEMSLLTDAPHNADVRTLTPTDVLVLPADRFRRLLESEPGLAEQIREVVERRRVDSAANRRNPARAEDLAGAIARGVPRGRHVLVRDPKLCADGCKICVDACAARHGHPRLRTGGLALGGLDVTDSCRQCRVGAECVEACPSDALQWNRRGAIVVTDSCTGCGQCVPACPYDAIELVPRAHGGAGPLWMLWERVQRLRNPTIPLEPVARAHRADKCDLCHGYDDLACVSACPTGALRLVPVEEVFRL